MKVKRGYIILSALVFCSLLCCAQQLQHAEQDKLKLLGLSFSAGTNEKIKAERTVVVWDSIFLLNKKGLVYNLLPVAVWENMLLQHYQQSVNTNDQQLQLQLALPLASVYHTQSKFTKSTPLLKLLFQNLKILPQYKRALVLIKLEESYRNFNEISDAVKVRNIRIENGFINTFWEIYFDCGLFEAAWKDFILFEPFPAENGIGRINYYASLGKIFFAAKEFDSARTYYQKGADEAALFYKTPQSKAESDLFWSGFFKGNIGACDVATGKYENAIPALLYDIAVSKKNIDNQIFKSLLLAECYIHTNETRKIKALLDSARIKMAEKSDKKIILKYYQVAAEYFKSINIYDSAIFYQEAYSAFSDTLNARIQQNQSVLILAKSDLEKRNKELATSLVALADQKIKSKAQKNKFTLIGVCLTAIIIICILVIINSRQKIKSKKAIEIQNLHLRENAKHIIAQNNYTAILLKELHHRVKNNLQVIYSLLNLQKRRFSNADMIELIEALQSRIQSMALIHQNLYTNDDFEMIDIKEYIETLINHLESIYTSTGRKPELIYDIGAIKLSIDKAIPLGLIINEAVSNSFKYAFAQSSEGCLRIAINQLQNCCVVEIKDNGGGFDITEIHDKSIGLKLIKTMCTQLKASYTLSTERGVKHHITFNA